MSITSADATMIVVLLILILAFLGAILGLALYVAEPFAKARRTLGNAPSAAHVMQLTETIADHVQATKVANANAPGLLAEMHGMVQHVMHLTARPAVVPEPPPPAPPAPKASSVTLDMLGAGMVPPFATHPLDTGALAALAKRLATLEAQSEPLPLVVQTTVTQPAAPESAAQTMPIADPTPTAPATVAAPVVAA